MELTPELQPLPSLLENAAEDLHALGIDVRDNPLCKHQSRCGDGIEDVADLAPEAAASSASRIAFRNERPIDPASSDGSGSADGAINSSTR